MGSTSSTQLTIDEDEDVLSIGFSESEGDAPVQYLLIQSTKSYNSEDQRTGVVNYYLELNDQLFSCYGGVRQIFLGNRQLVIELDALGQGRLKQQTINIGYSLSESVKATLKTKLIEVFGLIIVME